MSQPGLWSCTMSRSWSRRALPPRVLVRPLLHGGACRLQSSAQRARTQLRPSPGLWSRRALPPRVLSRPLLHRRARRRCRSAGRARTQQRCSLRFWSRARPRVPVVPNVLLPRARASSWPAASSHRCRQQLLARRRSSEDAAFEQQWACRSSSARACARRPLARSRPHRAAWTASRRHARRWPEAHVRATTLMMYPCHVSRSRSLLPELWPLRRPAPQPSAALPPERALR